MTAHASMWSKGEQFSTAGRIANLYNTMEINMAVNSENCIESNSYPSYTTFGHICWKDIPSYHKETFANMFIVILFIIAISWKMRCPLAKEWIKKMLYIYRMEYYSRFFKWYHEIYRQMVGTREKSLSIRQPRQRKTNMAFTHLWVHISCYVKDNHTKM